MLIADEAVVIDNKLFLLDLLNFVVKFVVLVVVESKANKEVWLVYVEGVKKNFCCCDGDIKLCGVCTVGVKRFNKYLRVIGEQALCSEFIADWLSKYTCSKAPKKILIY